MWVLMSWCFSTRASVATVLITHPCIPSCLWVNAIIPEQDAQNFADDIFKCVLLIKHCKFMDKFDGNALGNIWLMKNNLILGLNSQKSIIWTNDDLCHLYIYVSPGLKRIKAFLKQNIDVFWHELCKIVISLFVIRPCLWSVYGSE